MSHSIDDFPIDDAFVLVRVPWVLADKRTIDDSADDPLLTAHTNIAQGMFKEGDHYLPLFTERDYAEQALRSRPFRVKPPQQMAVATFAGWQYFLDFLKTWQARNVAYCVMDRKPRAKTVPAVPLSQIVNEAERNLNERT